MTRAVTVVVTMLLVLAGGGTGDTATPARADEAGRASAVFGSTASAPRPIAETTAASEPAAAATQHELTLVSDVVRIPRLALSPGDEGAMVTALQTLLSQAGFYRSEIDGEFGAHTSHAVVAFHKAIDAERTTEWNESDWEALANYRPSLPDRPNEPDRIEVDLTRQLLYRFADGAVVQPRPEPR